MDYHSQIPTARDDVIDPTNQVRRLILDRFPSRRGEKKILLRFKRSGECCTIVYCIKKVVEEL